MQTLKRPLALFITLVMMLTMLPLPAMAEGDAGVPAQASTETPAAAPGNTPAQTPADSGTGNEPAQQPAQASTETPAAAPGNAPAQTPADSAAGDEPAQQPAQAGTEAPAAAPENAPAQTPADSGEGNSSGETGDDSGIAAPAEGTPPEGPDSPAADTSAGSDAAAEGTPPENSDDTAGDALPEDVDDSAPNAAEGDSENNAPQEEAEAPAVLKFTLKSSAAPAAEVCQHPATEVGWDIAYTMYYEAVSDTQHRAKGYQYTYCTSCFEHIGESFEAEELYNHDFNSEGKCPTCGYSSSSGESPDTGSGCEHNNTEERFYYTNHVRYAQFNEEGHYIYLAGTIFCLDCRTEIGSSNTEMQAYDAHTLNDDGNCIYCGYGLDEGYCTHPDSNLVLDTDQPKVYYKRDENQHLVDFYQYHYCTSCNNRISESFLNATLENHDFDASGVCTLCGYGSDCKHSSWAQAWDNALAITYTKFTAAYHKKSGYQYSYCTNCLERGGDSFANEIYEAHDFDSSGVCTLCGYDPNDGSGCNHENVASGYSPLYDPPRYEQYNDTQHFVYHIFKTICLDCTETLLDGVETAGIEDHVLNNGKCTYCGYGMGEDYCKHPASDVMWSDAPMTYTSLNEKIHQIEGCQYHYCTNCYERICADFSVLEHENHTFDSAGSCTLCGYTAECTHSETRMELYDSSYTPVDKDYHTLQRLYSKICADPDCAEVLVEVEPSFTENTKEEHDFTDGKCLLCGYTAETVSLSVAVSADIVEADTGDMISATAAAAGGSGDYKYGWKVLLDGVVIRETDMGYGPSYAVYDTGAEGSYVFIVTVIDSDGNSATAQSEAISVVAHRCTFETVIVSTELKNPTQTHHDVVTTSYMECTVCHEKTDTVQTTVQEEHTMIKGSTAHEKAHPHKKYYACECGGRPYLEGQHHTANGKVQEESVCCICHGHKYGDEVETDEGTRQKICANCGLTSVTHTHDYELVQTTKLVNPDATKHYVKTTSTHKCKTCGNEKPGITVTIDEPHSPKNPGDYKFRDGHPHLRYAVCECGKEFDMQDEYKTANGTMQAPDVCCLCHGHVFGEPTEINAVIWKRICSVCGYEDRIAAPSQTETEATEPPANTNEKQELKDYNIDFIKKNALGKNDIYTLFFNDELRAEIEELSEGNAAKGYDFIDGDPAAHLGYAQADYYVDTLMKQCAELDPDSDTIRVSPGELKAICKIIGLEDTVIEAILKEWVWDDRDGCIMEADEFKDKLDQYKDDTGATLLDGLGKVVDIGTFIWDCLSDISVYNAALYGSASAMIDVAVVHMKNSGIDQAQTAAEYIEDLKDPEKRITYIIMKNAGIAEKVRDTITGATGSVPAWDIAFEAATLLNGGLFRTNDVIKSNHGTYWSLQLVDELYRNLESSIAQYENISSDKNYTACMDAYSLYITYLISSYNGVLETRENYSSSLVAQLITDKDVKEKEKALNEQYKAIMEWYEFDISAAINDFSIDQVVESIRDNGGFR